MLPERLSSLLRRIYEISPEPVFAVGGLLRDRELGRPLRLPLDLDVVVEGNGLELAGRLAHELEAELVAHPRFLTSTLRLPDGLEIDIATARTESYPYPGALPVVQPGTLRQDLWRRDFTINSLAAPITPHGLGPLLDLTDGLADLRAGLVRVLHPGSFFDDPTRIFRAARFEQRFGFRIAPDTLRLVESALAQEMLGQISRERIRNELILACQEGSPLAVIGRLQQLLVLPHLGFPTRWSRRRVAFLEAVQGDWKTWVQAFLFESSQRMGLLQEYRFEVSCSEVAWPELLWELSRSPLANSRLYSLLHRLTPEEQIVLAARVAGSPVARRRVERYSRELRMIQPLLRGQHLIARGLKPGPPFARWLRDGFAAQLNAGWTRVEQALEWFDCSSENL